MESDSEPDEGRRGKDEAQIINIDDEEEQKPVLMLPMDVKEEYFNRLKEHIDRNIKEIFREETDELIMNYSVQTAKNIEDELKSFHHMLNVDMDEHLQKTFMHDQVLMMHDTTLEHQDRMIKSLKATHYRFKVFKWLYSRLFRYPRIKRKSKLNQTLVELKEKMSQIARKLELLETEQISMKRLSKIQQKNSELAKKYTDLLNEMGGEDDDEIKVYVDSKYKPSPSAREKKLKKRKKVRVRTEEVG